MTHLSVRNALLFLVLALTLNVAHAATMTFISDTISTSAPSTLADHTIRFTTTGAIPADGRVVIIPQDGQFSIPSALGSTDLDLSVSGVDTALAPAASGSTVGVAVVSGTSGSITLTFAQGVAAQSALVVTIGTNAVSGAQGTHSITNPTTTGSYAVSIRSEDSSSVVIDTAKAMVAILDPVDVSASQPTPVPGQSPTNTGGGGTPSSRRPLPAASSSPPVLPIVGPGVTTESTTTAPALPQGGEISGAEASTTATGGRVQPEIFPTKVPSWSGGRTGVVQPTPTHPFWLLLVLLLFVLWMVVRYWRCFFARDDRPDERPRVDIV